ncbi:MAG: PQQ-dependent sugar dehydrogenase [Verrucomicrobia bacterium]|nr:PQQ-dependent sugar dehydrogenase [Verrucomicrobiota bacterium]
MSNSIPRSAERFRCGTFALVAFVAFVLCDSGQCFAAESAKIALKVFSEGYVSPTDLAPIEDGSGRLLVADQIGVIYTVGKDGQRSEAPFLDIRDRLARINSGAFDERGLLGLALHPKFNENRKFFVFYSAPLRSGGPEGWDHTAHLSEFSVFEGNSNRANPASERVLLQIDQPQFNHNCGRMSFGPDGYLYVGVGDGGQANDAGLGHGERGNGQDVTTLLGKILRIDVDKGDPYGIPSDNPFVGGKGRPEIFSYGHRNPWGISFDRGGNHELFAAEVGQDRFEEVNIIVKGGNYGWRLREGFEGFNPEDSIHPRSEAPKTGANGEPLLDPIIMYKNFKGHRRDPEASGTSVTGGYVYRGKAIPSLAGSYIFGDWSRNFVVAQGVLFVAIRSGQQSPAWTMKPLDLATHANGNLREFVVAFGQDADGEVYVMTNASNSLRGTTGKIYKIVPQ